jgi:hypothetical protein
MLAFAALVSFLLAFILKLLGTSTGNIDLVILGLAFVAAHLATGSRWAIGRP